MTVAEMYLRTDNERIVILELNKVLYSGFFDDIPLKYLETRSSMFGGTNE